MRKFTTAVVVRLAAAVLAGAALTATVAQVAQDSGSSAPAPAAAVTVTVDGSGVGDSLPGDNWPWG